MPGKRRRNICLILSHSSKEVAEWGYGLGSRKDAIDWIGDWKVKRVSGSANILPVISQFNGNKMIMRWSRRLTKVNTGNKMIMRWSRRMTRVNTVKSLKGFTILGTRIA